MFSPIYSLGPLYESPTKPIKEDQKSFLSGLADVIAERQQQPANYRSQKR